MISNVIQKVRDKDTTRAILGEVQRVGVAIAVVVSVIDITIVGNVGSGTRCVVGIFSIRWIYIGWLSIFLIVSRCVGVQSCSITGIIIDRVTINVIVVDVVCVAGIRWMILDNIWRCRRR